MGKITPIYLPDFRHRPGNRRCSRFHSPTKGRPLHCRDFHLHKIVLPRVRHRWKCSPNHQGFFAARRGTNAARGPANGDRSVAGEAYKAWNSVQGAAKEYSLATSTEGWDTASFRENQIHPAMPFHDDGDDAA